MLKVGEICLTKEQHVGRIISSKDGYFGCSTYVVKILERCSTSKPDFEWLTEETELTHIDYRISELKYQLTKLERIKREYT